MSLIFLVEIKTTNGMANKSGKCRIWGVYENEFEVRDGISSDLKTVYSMIIELAEDLKADVSEDVSSSEAQFISDFQNGYFHLIVAKKKTNPPTKEHDKHQIIKEDSNFIREDDEHDSIVGYALYIFGYETWTGRVLKLDDIYIRKNYRKLGLGTYVMSILAKISLENHCKSFKWQCLDWNNAALDFYFQKLKAVEEILEKDGEKCKLINIEMCEDEIKTLAQQLK